MIATGQKEDWLLLARRDAQSVRVIEAGEGRKEGYRIAVQNWPHDGSGQTRTDGRTRTATALDTRFPVLPI